MINTSDPGLPIEHFIQALTSQLDRVQSSMAMKARVLGYPLTFAVKDLSLDLRTHVEMVGSVVRIRPAAPGETEASVLHLTLTTITRPMVEENTLQLQTSQEDPPLKQALGHDMTEDERRRLEWIGVQTVSQLRQLHEQAGVDTIQRVSDIPIGRLRRALELTAPGLPNDIIGQVEGGPPVPEPAATPAPGPAPMPETLPMQPSPELLRPNLRFENAVLAPEVSARFGGPAAPIAEAPR
jgi:hypothetical protein